MIIILLNNIIYFFTTFQKHTSQEGKYYCTPCMNIHFIQKHIIMTTVIVPIDFSPISVHTAHYAAQLLVGHHGVNILLYHCYAKTSEETAEKKSL